MHKVVNRDMITNPTHSCWLKWDPPDQGFVKLNIDGSYKAESNLDGGGEVFCNDQGCWISWFTVNLGKASYVLAELWGLLYGLKLVTDLKFSHVMVELNSKMVVSWFNEGVSFT